MSLKNVLGMMLASRMAGRGRGGFGRGAMLGGLAGLGGRTGRKAGLAGLAYMAYRAYQDRAQDQTARPTPGSGSGADAADRTGGSLGDRIGSFVDQLTGTTSGKATTDTATDIGTDDIEGARAADSISEDTALLLLRGMIAAANADGTITQDERSRILQELERAGADDQDRRTMMHELDAPKPLHTLVGQIHDEETALEFYLASRAAVDAESPAHRDYLQNLRRRLDLSEEDLREIDALAP